MLTTTAYFASKKKQTLLLSDSALEIQSGDTTTATVLEHTGDGALSVQSSDSSIATCSISGNTITIIGVAGGEVTITVTASSTPSYQEATASILVTSTSVGIWGVYWDGSSSPQMTRTDDAADFPDPNPYYSGMSDTPSSPFDNLSPWKDMTIVEDENAGTVVRIPKFWYQYVKGGTSNDQFRGVKISNAPQDGFSVSPAHMDRGDGAGERDYVYVGRYHSANLLYKSLSGQSPASNVTRSIARANQHTLGSNIWLWDYTTLTTIWLLYLVEFSHWDSQLKIGYGCGNGSSYVNTGYTDSMPYHTGTTQSSRDTYGSGCQYRYIEGLWDNLYNWVDGIRFQGAYTYLYYNPSSFSDTENGMYIGSTIPVNGGGIISAFYISGTTATSWAMYPSNRNYNSNYSIYACDEVYNNSSGYYNLLTGGNYGDQSRHYGLFCLNGDTSYDSRNSYAGVRLMILP